MAEAVNGEKLTMREKFIIAGESVEITTPTKN